MRYRAVGGRNLTAMLAILSTSRGLLLADIIRDEVALLETCQPEYYGISWFPGDPRLVASHSHVDNNALHDLPGYALSEVGTLGVGGLELGAYGLSAPHQLACGFDGLIYATNTGR